MKRQRCNACKRLMVAAILGTIFPLGVSAEEGSSPLPQIAAQIEKLQGEIQRLQVAVEDLRQKQQVAARDAAPPPSLTVAAGPAEKKPSPPEWINRFNFGVTSYLRYSRELQPERKEFNEFELDRIYFIVYTRLTDRLRLRYTMEGARRDGAGDFDVATKHFYLEASDLFYKSSRLVLGQHDLPWVPYEENLWGYRFQGTVFPDREGYLTSTDLGLGWKGSFPKRYGDYHFSVVNGEGWTARETGKHKDIHLRVSVKPFAQQGWARHLFFTGFRSVGAYEDVPAGLPNDRQRTIVQLGFQHPHLLLAAEHLRAADLADRMQRRHPSLARRAGQVSQARGYSFFGVLNFGLFSEAAKNWEAIARFDRLDPDIRIGNNGHGRWITGLSYRWNGYLRTLLNYERVRLDSASLRPAERRLMLQTEIKF